MPGEARDQGVREAGLLGEADEPVQEGFVRHVRGFRRDGHARREAGQVGEQGSSISDPSEPLEEAGPVKRHDVADLDLLRPVHRARLGGRHFDRAFGVTFPSLHDPGGSPVPCMKIGGVVAPARTPGLVVFAPAAAHVGEEQRLLILERLLEASKDSDVAEALGGLEPHA